MEAWNGFWMSAFFTLHCFILKQGILLNSEFCCYSYIFWCVVPSLFLSFPRIKGCDLHQDYMISGIHTHVLMFPWKCFTCRGTFPALRILIFPVCLSVWMPQLCCTSDILTSLKGSHIMMVWSCLTYDLAFSEIVFPMTVH